VAHQLQVKVGELLTKVRSIGILGTRGIPARYGGFETAAETIAVGLRRAGFRVVAACETDNSSRMRPDNFQGIELVYFSVRNSLRPLSEIFYDIRSLLAVGTRVDAIYMLGYGAGFFFWIARLLRKTLVVNSDGMEWKRPKFGRISRFLLRVSERFGLTAANVIVADSKCVARYVEQTYGKTPIFLAYGTAPISPTPSWNPNLLEEWQPGLSRLLRPDNYYLVLARMEPDNNIDKIIQGFALSRTTRKLLLVGPCISPQYLSRLKGLVARDDRVVLAGAVYDLRIKTMLRWHCAAYIHGHMVGGTNPSLLEALSAGNVVIGTDIEFNKEVIGNGRELPAFYFYPDPPSIAKAIDTADPELMTLRARARLEGPARIREAYNWVDIIHGYVSLFNTI
jgi:glycosyltransferase involved in cell wall biosynthesis